MGIPCKAASTIKFSIIIPVYNVEDYIEKSLGSCLDQDFDCSEYEVIVINDGSTDSSLEKVLKISQEHSNVRCFNQEHEGPGAARNRGMKEATGEYLWFVDSDDWIDRNCLKLLYEKVSLNELDLLWIGLRRVDYSKNKFSDYPNGNLTKNILSGDVFLDKVFSFYCYVVLFIFKRSFLLSTGCTFVNGILYEDAEFLPRVIMRSERIKYDDIICYNYLKRPNSIIHTINEKKIDDLLYVIQNHWQIIHTSSNEKTIKYFKRFVTHLVVILIRLSSHPSYQHRQQYIQEALRLNKITSLKTTTPWMTFVCAVVYNLSPNLLMNLFNIGRQLPKNLKF